MFRMLFFRPVAATPLEMVNILGVAQNGQEAIDAIKFSGSLQSATSGHGVVNKQNTFSVYSLFSRDAKQFNLLMSWKGELSEIKLR